MRLSPPSLLRWLIVLCFSLGVVKGQTLQYGIISDNFQGQSGLPGGFVLTGNNYLNFPDTSTGASGLPRLKIFSATTSNRNATETITTGLNFTDTSSGGAPKGLCNGTSAAASCGAGKGWMGRVMYTMIKFPVSGTYYFTLAHDDGVEIDLSGQLTVTDPRTATYGTVLGGVNSYTSNDSTYETLTTTPFVVNASACYLMRVYWNNQGGVNHLRLRYGTQSNLSDQALIPTTQYLLPGVAANWNSCTNPTLTIKKQSVGGTGSFTFTGTNGYSGETITTTATSTPVSGSTFALTNQYAATSVTETGPSTFGLISSDCTDVNAAVSGNPSTVPSTLSGNTVTIASTYIIPQAQIQCTLTNSMLGTLSLSKSSNGPWTAGQTGATYTLTARNNNGTGGSSITAPFTIRDVLPSGITVPNGTVTLSGTNAANWSCSATGNVLTCTSNTALAANTASTFTFGVTVGASAPSTVTNYASIAGSGGTPVTPGTTCTNTSTCASINTTVLTKPTITKAFSPSSILSTDTSTITFTLTNSNATPLTTLNFTDTLTNMTVNSATLGGTCADSGMVSNSPTLAVGATSLNLTVAALGANSSCTVTVVIKPTTSGTLPNSTSGVKSTETPTVGTVSNTANLIVSNSADLSITKTGPSTAVSGTTISYTLTLSNAGPAPANGATFSDSVPSTLTGVTATCNTYTGSAAGCSASVSGSNVVTGSVTTFPSGGSVQVLITGTIPAGATASLSNVATVAAPSGVTDPATANNTSATVTTTLTKQAELSVTKTDALSAVSNGQTVTYTIVVANAGPSSTTGSFADTTFSGVTLSNWTCTGTTGTANCPSGLPTSGGYSNSLLNLPTGSTITFQVTGTVTATSGSVSNTATIKAPAAVANAAGTLGAISTVTDTDTILADLSLTKTGAAAAQPGTLVTYTLSVSNAGPSTATSITLTDSLPTGATFTATDQASGFSGVYNGSTTPKTVTWTLSNMTTTAAPQTVTLVLRMPNASAVRGDATTTPATAGITSVTNSATVSSPSDTVTANNTATATTNMVLLELLKRVRNVTADLRDNGGTPRFDTNGQGLPGELLEYCLTFRNLGGVAVSGFGVSDNVPSNVTAQTNAYGSPNLGISVLRGGSGTAGSATVSGGNPLLLLTSSADSDGGSLTTSGGSFGQGLLTTVLPTPVAVGESGQVCFRATIR
ncbi:PA14 domain-containing protein [Deinococcus sp. KNUC1210]|uniref:beta strand repeat-containing protein n=1 Tax=Deinococcus sp. KNUC1210 TaxID=2917691 RepID=UPI001EF14D27|nr:PA14 domain-containing protein [Deinococcus sp. KNUC1210]ULH14391.1 PA14 domain-containing protein [Deinococcus sp. KNUC1210]